MVRSIPSALTLPLRIASLSLYSSAFLAKASVILTLSLSIAWPPMLSIGIMSAPLLPNRAIANAVLVTPSGIALNLSAISRVTASALLSLPLASVALIPRAFSASAALPLPVVAASNMPLLSRPRLLATESISVPLVAAAFLNFARASTLTPVRWLRSFIASPASMAPFTRPTSPAALISGSRAPRELVNSADDPAMPRMATDAPAAVCCTPCSPRFNATI